MVERDPSSELKDENARLIALLEANGIQWRVLREPVPSASAPEPSPLSTDENVALFRRLFRGRTDVYPVRWESKTTAKSGYSPACANECALLHMPACPGMPKIMPAEILDPGAL